MNIFKHLRKILSIELIHIPQNKKRPIDEIIESSRQGLFSYLAYLCIIPIGIIFVAYLILGNLFGIIDILFNTSITVILDISDSGLMNIGIAMMFSIIMMFVFSYLYSVIITFTVNKIESIEEILENTKLQIEEISEIQKKAHHIYTFVRILRYMNYSYFLIGGKNYKKKLKDYLEEKVYKITFFLTDLRSDLLIRLTEQQKSLKSAKSEVESHIKGTTELNQVSELQRIRLDKQIEQFEELQRVLVKV